MTEPRWRKSSFSGNEGDCVELVSTMDAIRDSKNPANTLAVDALHDLLNAIRHEQLTR